MTGVMTTRETVNRRGFFGRTWDGMLKWSPILGMLGFRFHSYARPALVGWRGWVTWFGRCAGFVRLDGSVRWWP